MENKIREYKNKIEFLERKVSDLEKLNAGLRECLLRNLQFSTKLSKITYEMDCLLERKGQEIRDLEEKLKEFSTRTACTYSEPSPISEEIPEYPVLDEIPVHGDIEDFDIDLPSEKGEENGSVPAKSEFSDINDYVKIFVSKKPNLKRNSNGHFECSKCKYITLKTTNIHRHIKTHTDERPFGCKLCQNRFKSMNGVIYHLRTHDDRFKLKCSICEAKFANPKRLSEHATKYHNGMGYERKRKNVKIKQDSVLH